MKKLRVIIMVVVALVAGYEIAFRYCTAQWGEVNTDTTPFSLYYSCDLMLGCRVFQTVFAPRAALPFGKVRLAEGTGAYICGGRFYRKRQDGTWQDVTAAIREKKRNTENEPSTGAYALPRAAQP